MYYVFFGFYSKLQKGTFIDGIRYPSVYYKPTPGRVNRSDAIKMRNGDKRIAVKLLTECGHFLRRQGVRANRKFGTRFVCKKFNE